MKAFLKVFSFSVSQRFCGSLPKRTHPLTQVVLTCLLAAFCLPVLAQTKDFAKWVNPFIGTGAHGHTFPGATRPFGMVQLSPDTRIDNWDGSSGYHYSDDIIYGFSHLHLSGTGIPDGSDILITPKLDDSLSSSKMYPSKFSHANEKAEPGYYSVKLDDSGIFAELTSTSRVGMHRYTVPAKSASFVVDLNWRDKVLDSNIKVTEKGLEGFRESASWAKNQRVYFVIEFSKQLEYKVMITSSSLSAKTEDGSPGKVSVRSLVKFDTQPGEKILVKVGISHVSIDGARKNLEAELPHWDFDKVRAEARDEWNKELGKIEVSGGTDEQTTNFYSALYHTMIHPNVFNDVDGKYRGHDGKVHILDRRQETGDARQRPRTEAPKPRHQPEQYTVFSLWDTFRAAHPLYTIIDEKRTVDLINTFLRIYDQGGRLPVWELWGEETDTMIGYHSVSVIADAMAKEIKGFDYDKAFAAAKHSANLDHHGLAAYKKRGYISGEDDNESVSKTLEYAYNDWCIASMAETLIRLRQNENRAKRLPENDEYVKEKIADYQKYIRRARNFENLFDPKTKFFRPKRNADFVSPFAPNEVTFHFTEGNSWQYSFFAPHDVDRLINLMGGRQQFIYKLDELFETDQKLTGRFQPDITGLIGQYAHGNEPSHHIPYLYNFAHAPSKTQERVRYILDNFYKNTPEGLIGNEDAGQMSAWYVLSASGFYPTTPGQTWYDLGTPLFKEVKFNLENGKTFVIKVPNVSPKNIYINKATFNNRNHFSSYIRHEEIMRGGVLELEMTDKPNDKAFIQYSRMGIYTEYAVVPVISGERVFAEKTEVKIAATLPGSKIFFTKDGSTPTKDSTPYSGPFEVSDTTTIKAITIAPRGDVSPVTEAVYSKRPNDWSVTLLSEYSSQYPGNGADTIIDSLRGNTSFAAGEWQGFQGKTFEAVIDLKRPTKINEVGGNFLQSARSWIWMPARIEFQATSNGVDFKTIAEIKTDVPLTEMEPLIKEFTTKVSPGTATAIRVRAFSIGKIPQWHLGAGGDPWIFVDEVIIK